MTVKDDVRWGGQGGLLEETSLTQKSEGSKVVRHAGFEGKNSAGRSHGMGVWLTHSGTGSQEREIVRSQTLFDFVGHDRTLKFPPRVRGVIRRLSKKLTH